MLPGRASARGPHRSNEPSRLILELLGPQAVSLVLYLLLCLVSSAAGLALLRFTVPLLPLSHRLLLAPVTTMALWAVTIGMGVALNVRLPILTVPLWAVTLVLAVVTLWREVRDRGARLSAREGGVFVACLLLPIWLLPGYFRYGLANYPGSQVEDGWSYVAFGQYLWDFRRHVTSGLSPLFIYGSHLSEGRYISSALLGMLSQLSSCLDPTLPTGEVQVGVGLFWTWTIFVFAASCASAAVAQGFRGMWAGGAVLFTVLSGWVLNLVLINNFDNAACLGFFPALFAILSVIVPGSGRPALLVGFLTAGLLYTYVELAPLVLMGSLLVVMVRLRGEPFGWRAWAWTIAVAAISATLLLAPFVGELVVYLRRQAQAGLASGLRPGGEAFAGLTSLAFQPSALWALGGEHKLVGGNLLGGVFSALALVGLVDLARRRQLALLLNVLFLTVPFLVLVVSQRYGYGAYKILLIAWWALGLVVMSGVEALLRRAPKAQPACILVLSIFVLHSVHGRFGAQMLRAHSSNFRNSMKYVSVVSDVGHVVGSQAVLVAVDDEVASRWAIYYLRRLPIHIGAHRGILASPHLRSGLGKGRPVSLTDIGYVLTDDSDKSGLGRDGRFHLAWSGGHYRLWDVRSGGWATIVRTESPEGPASDSGRSLIWLGQRETTLEVLTPYARTLQLSADLVPAPSQAGAASFRLLVSNDRGYRREVAVSPGPTVITLTGHPRRNRIKLQVLGPLPAPPNGQGVGNAPTIGLRDPGIRPRDDDAVLEQVDNPNGGGILGGQAFYWLGSEPMQIRVYSSRGGLLRLGGHFQPGPAIPRAQAWHVLVTSPGEKVTVTLKAGDDSFQLPLGPGETTLSLQVLDRPKRPPPADDPRTMIMGMRDPWVRLEEPTSPLEATPASGGID